MYGVSEAGGISEHRSGLEYLSQIITLLPNEFLKIIEERISPAFSSVPGHSS